MNSNEIDLASAEDLKFNRALAGPAPSTGLLVEGNEIIFSILVGAFFGLICGFMLTHALRYFSLLLGRNVSGNAWPIWGAVVGAILCVCWCLAEDE